MDLKRHRYTEAKHVSLSVPPHGQRECFSKAIIAVARAAGALWSDICYVVQDQQLTQGASMQLRLFVESSHNWVVFMMR